MDTALLYSLVHNSTCSYREQLEIIKKFVGALGVPFTEENGQSRTSGERSRNNDSYSAFLPNSNTADIVELWSWPLTNPVVRTPKCIVIFIAKIS